MRQSPRFLRRLGLLLAVLCLLCLTPGRARANSAHNPYYKDVFLSDTRDVDSIAVYVEKSDGSFYLFKTFESEHKKEQRIYFERPEDAARFYIEITMTDGTVRASEPADCTGYDQVFKYDVKANTLKQAITSQLGWLFVPLVLLALAGMFALPLGFTVLVEFLAALPFRLKPYKYVIFVNLITNSVMNIVLYFLRVGGGGGLWVIALLEVVVVLVEYFFYTKKYREQPKGKLFAFSIVANALSWGLYELIQRIFFGL